MTLWDGLSTKQSNNRILIIGATNRPEDVDAAILRRMPQMFYIGLPVSNLLGLSFESLFLNLNKFKERNSTDEDFESDFKR